MIHLRHPLCAALAAGTFLLGAPRARADEALKKQLEKPVETLVKAVRYSENPNDARTQKALKQLDGESQGRILLAGDWDTGTAEQRAEFISLFHKLFAAIAFPKLKDSLHYLGTTVYDNPAVSGDTAQLGSTLAIDNPLKKEEFRLRFDLHKTREGWKVVDMTVLGVGGKSMLTDIRDEQIVPIMKSGGWPKLLELMKQRLVQVSGK